MVNQESQKTLDTGRLLILLIAPFTSMGFSLLSIIFSLMPDGDTVDMVAGTLIGFSGLTGFMSLVVGMTVLITQLVKNNLNAKNIAYFISAWFMSVLIFIFATTLM